MSSEPPSKSAKMSTECPQESMTATKIKSPVKQNIQKEGTSKVLLMMAWQEIKAKEL